MPKSAHQPFVYQDFERILMEAEDRSQNFPKSHCNVLVRKLPNFVPSGKVLKGLFTKIVTCLAFTSSSIAYGGISAFFPFYRIYIFFNNL